ncbi:nucleoporin NUP35-like [Lytechinus variegatus]|uniref:nucleoporin NUP35-like n=1 Tax=Lytechinus variegatus TaxID=7654 RepID=UPI001BB17B4B|nr:nucleoporin NUP35-like [Lytechinus variegatus]
MEGPQGTESMILGSPQSSSTSLPSSLSSQFLPAYLIGEQSPAVSPASGRQRTLLRSPSRTMSPSTLGPRDSSLLRIDSTENRVGQTPRTTSHTPKDKGNAPPVAGLYDPIEASRGSPAVFDTPERRQLDFTQAPSRASRTLDSPAASRLFSPSQQSMVQSSQWSMQAPPSPPQVDPFYTQGESILPEDELDDTWITIFGFQSAATSYILQQFSQYGNIVSHVVASSGNWMHVQYSSRIQARKALSKNGKVFGGNIMVGVTPCIDKGVMSGGTSDSYGVNTTGIGDAPITPAKRLASQSEEQETTRRTPIRPLTAAYKAASNPHEVIQESRTPQKSSNVVSKTLEYMFGW